MDPNIWAAVFAEEDKKSQENEQKSVEPSVDADTASNVEITDEPTDDSFGGYAGDEEFGIPAEDDNGSDGESAENGESDEQEQKQPGRGLLDWAQALALAISAIVIIFTFFARIIGVDGDSMNPTLIDRDRLIISHIAYDPTPGDIVVIHVEGYSEPLIKRVVATEGQTVMLAPDEGLVYVDGVALDEPYTAEPTRKNYDVPAYTDIVVPDGCLFVMGDNRNHSSDSRSATVGMIDERQVIGRALWRLFPLGSFGGL